MKHLLSLSVVALLAFFSGWYLRDLSAPNTPATQPEPQLQAAKINENIHQSPKKEPGNVKENESQSISPEQHMLSLLDSNKFKQAVNFYETYYNQQNTAIADKLYILIVQRLQKLFLNEEYTPVLILANSMLDSFYDDFNILFIKANTEAALDQLFTAIDTYYEALNTHPDPQQSEEIRNTIHSLALQLYEQLSGQKAWPKLEEFYRNLLNREGDYPPYHLYYAAILIKLNELSTAADYLSPLLTDPELGHVAKLMLQRIELLQAGGSVTPLQKSGKHFITTVSLNNIESRLLLDTGASFSTMTPELFNKLDPSAYSMLQKELTVSTANGLQTASLYSIDQLQINKHVLYDVEFIVLPMDSSFSANGLLGMNVLSQFRFQIDQINSELILEPL